MNRDEVIDKIFAGRFGPTGSDDGDRALEMFERFQSHALEMLEQKQASVREGYREDRDDFRKEILRFVKLQERISTLDRDKLESFTRRLISDYIKVKSRALRAELEVCWYDQATNHE